MVAPQVVIMTTCGATSDDKFAIMTTLDFQWMDCFLLREKKLSRYNIVVFTSLAILTAKDLTFWYWE